MYMHKIAYVQKLATQSSTRIFIHIALLLFQKLVNMQGIQIKGGTFVIILTPTWGYVVQINDI